MMGTGRWRSGFAAAGLVALVVAAFWNALPREFTFDSVPIVQDHAFLAEGSPWWRLFVKTYWGDTSSGGLYRPGVMLTYWVEKRVLGFDAAWQHAVVNIGLHLVNVLLVWRVARGWSGDRRAAWVAAALFAVHPVGTEVVPNLVGRADLMALAGVLGAVVCWERAWGERDTGMSLGTDPGVPEPRERARWGWVVGAAVCWGVGLFAKESAVVLVGVLVVMEGWRGASTQAWAKPQAWLRERAVGYGVLGVVGLGWAVGYWHATSHAVPLWVSPLGNPIALASWDQRIMTAVLVWGLYLRLAVLPVWMSADHSYADVMLVDSPGDPAYLAALAVVLGYVVLTVWLWRWGSRRGRAAAMGLTFAALAISPVSNVVVTIGTIFAERLMYLPLAGIAVAAGVGVVEGVRWFGAKNTGTEVPEPWVRRWEWGVVGVVVLALGVRTWQRNEVWKDSASLWEQTVLDSPANHKPYHVLGKMALDEGNFDAAVVQIEQAVAIVRDLPAQITVAVLIDAAGAHTDRAEALRRAGGDERRVRADLERAVELMLAAVRSFQEPGLMTAYLARAEAFAKAEGVNLPADEPFVKVLINLSKALYALGRWEEAAAVLSEASARRPKDAEVMAALGRSLARAGRWEEAEDVLGRAVGMDERFRGDWERVREERAKTQALPGDGGEEGAKPQAVPGVR